LANSQPTPQPTLRSIVIKSLPKVIKKLKEGDGEMVNVEEEKGENRKEGD